MADDWPFISIDEIKAKSKNALAMGPFGSNITTDNFVPSGVPVIRGKNLDKGFLNENGFVFLTDEKADALRSANAFPGDVIFTHRGTLGQIGIIPGNARYSRYVISQSQMKLTCDKSKVDPLFVYYFFKSSEGQSSLLAFTSTTGVPAISQPLTNLKTILIPYPPLPVQKSISHILEVLDNSIILKNQINGSLESIARAVFKSWFVDFDPVRAKAEGKRLFGMDDETAALFPDSFENSKLGEIPKGWAVRSFSDIVDIIGGGTPKTSISEYWNGEYPWFSMNDLPMESDIFVIDTQRHISSEGLESSSTKMLDEGTTIVTARGTVGKLALVGVPMAMNQSCYAIRGAQGYSNYYTYFCLNGLMRDLVQQSHGTIFDTITTRTFQKVTIPAPPPELARVFDKKVEPLLKRIKNNLAESSTLQAIRDTLLPKLLSGEIRMPVDQTKEMYLGRRVAAR